jgi:phosphate-selective porin OprO and OprP
MTRTMALVAAVAAGLSLAGQAVVAQSPPKLVEVPRDSSPALTLTAGEADDAQPSPRQWIRRPEWNLGFTTLHLGGGLLYDAILYSQDSISSEQFPSLDAGFKLRDARVLLGGRFDMERSFTWQLGVMYDAANEEWLVRQSGLMVAVPEIHSWFFVGRAKEGFSLNKVMVGYDGWSMERLPFTDATVPLLADGIKWLGYVASRHWFWNLGLFTDVLSEGQSFSSYNYQLAARTGYSRMSSDTAGTLVHVGMNFRVGDVNGDSLQLRSRPEAFAAPYFIDTGKFPAKSAFAFGPEIYYRPGRLLIGGEYYWQKVSSPEMGNPWFHGGEAAVVWLATGETRQFNLAGAYFREASPDSTVVQRGAGAWSPVIKFSYSNLTNGPVQGGIFWRITPMLNWYLTDNVRLEFGYGHGVLNQSGVKGETNFFQSRLQLRL